MTDQATLQQIERQVGRPFPHVVEEGRCVELSLTSSEALYHGLIRHHPPFEKQAILRLVCQLTGLRKLDLRRNLLRQLPSEFVNLKELEHLNLGSNYLGVVPDVLRGLRGLRFLQLGNNDLTELPGFFADFQNLEQLALHKNLRLKTIDSLNGLTRLKALNLYFVNLLALPAFVFEFRNLVTLSLWNVSRFPESMEAFQALEFFTNCGGPSVRALPPGFTKLKKLRMTRLFQNNLEALPDDMDRLVNLEQISLYQNQLTCLPDSMAQLKQLTKINLGWNRFEALPAWLGELPQLRWLGVFENPLKDLVQLPQRAGLRVDREWPFSTVVATV